MACPDSLVDSNIQSKELHDLPGVYHLHNGLIRKSDLPRCVRLCCLLTTPHDLGAKHILAHLPVAKPKTKKLLKYVDSSPVSAASFLKNYTSSLLGLQH
jgi:hypothetical protein